MRKLYGKYRPEDNFNFDETGLFGLYVLNSALLYMVSQSLEVHLQIVVSPLYRCLGKRQARLASHSALCAMLQGLRNFRSSSLANTRSPAASVTRGQMNVATITGTTRLHG